MIGVIINNVIAPILAIQLPIGINYGVFILGSVGVILVIRGVTKIV